MIAVVKKKPMRKTHRLDLKEIKENFFGHLHTVNTHRKEVFKNCVKAGIPLSGLTHDLSKYSPAEFIPSVLHYSGKRSPNEGEREHYGYSRAWMHHKGRNKHHYEYWTDVDPATRKYASVKMPLKYVKEMFCDRVAASKVYLGENYVDSDPLAYFMRGNGRKNMHPHTAVLLERLLKLLAEQGEDYTFDYIRRLKKY